MKKKSFFFATATSAGRLECAEESASALSQGTFGEAEPRSGAQAPAKMPVGVELSAERQRKTVNLIMAWIDRQLNSRNDDGVRKLAE